MANNISSMLNSKLRMTGLASGLDTDTMIKQIMAVEKAKVDKVKQDKQLLEWKRDNYRDITNLLRGFKDEYFDVLKPSTNFRSATTFAAHTASSTNESIATAKAGGGVAAKSHTLKVTSLAKAAKIEGTLGATAAVTGSLNVTDLSLQGKQITVNLDGSSKTFDLEDYASINDLQTKLQGKIDTAFGADKIDLILNGSKLEFKNLLNGSTFTLSEPSNNFISKLGFTDGMKNFVTGTDITESDLSGLNGTIRVTLNGLEKVISLSGLSSTSTLGDVRTMLETKLNDATDGYGPGTVNIALNGNKLEIQSKTGKELALYETDSAVLSKLGFTDRTKISGTSTSVLNLSENEKGKTFVLNVNGEEAEIEIDNDYANVTALAGFIQSKIDEIALTKPAFDGITVAKDMIFDKLVFSSNNNEQITFKKGADDSLLKLGYDTVDNKSNKISLKSGLDSIEKSFAASVNFDASANVQLVINDVTINVGKTFANATLSDVMNAINGSSAGVELKYDSLKDGFSLVSKSTGEASNITYTDTDPTNGLLKALGIAGQPVIAGEDANFELDGVAGMKRSSNDFSIDGVSYTLKSADPATTVTINVNSDPAPLLDKIKSFVAKYNEVIDKVNAELSEKKERSYLPLTDEQKSELSEDDIEKWEEKAKSGLLKSDSILSNLVTSMRRALFDPINNLSVSLTQIGITTGTYQSKGKLIIDENKLKAAITQNAEGIAQLFTNESQYSYNDTLADPSKRSTRYQEIGLAQRLNDLIQDNIRTSRDQSGKKGALLERAGISSDLSGTDNFITNQINNKDILINTMLDRLTNKENSLYLKFASLEKAMSQMNSQSGWLAQQFGGGQ